MSSGETGHAETSRSSTIPRRSLTENCCAYFSLSLLIPRNSTARVPTKARNIARSIFYSTDEQKRIAEAYIAQLDKAKVFPRPIVTQVVPLQAFYPAEAYHQNYATLHPDQPYIVFNDAPKVEHLKQEFPDLYTGK